MRHSVTIEGPLGYGIDAGRVWCSSYFHLSKLNLAVLKGHVDLSSVLITKCATSRRYSLAIGSTAVAVMRACECDCATS